MFLRLGSVVAFQRTVLRRYRPIFACRTRCVRDIAWCASVDLRGHERAPPRQLHAIGSVKDYGGCHSHGGRCRGLCIRALFKPVLFVVLLFKGAESISCPAGEFRSWLCRRGGWLAPLES